MISIEEFFFDDPAITPENPWKPLPKHSLEQSPCYPIIGIHNKYKVPFYYCKLHPDIENINGARYNIHGYHAQGIVKLQLQL